MQVWHRGRSEPGKKVATVDAHLSFLHGRASFQMLGRKLEPWVHYVLDLFWSVMARRRVS